MATHQSTIDYLARTTTAKTDAHDPIRTAARGSSGHLATLRRAIADRMELLFTVMLDEDTPGVKALLYESQDKLKSVERIAIDAAEVLGRLVAVLGEDEVVTARMQAAADAANAPAPDPDPVP